MARRKRLPGPIDVEIVGIGDGGVGLGTYEEHQLLVRGAPLGAPLGLLFLAEWPRNAIPGHFQSEPGRLRWLLCG